MQMDLLKMKEVLQNCWTVETAHPGYRGKWSRDRPCTGQCAVTALLIFELFGGNIISSKSQKGERHYWNLINDQEIDLTIEQFSYTPVFKHCSICKPTNLRKSLGNRYILLYQNFLINNNN